MLAPSGLVATFCSRSRFHPLPCEPPLCPALLPVPPRRLAFLRAALCSTQHIIAFTAAHCASRADLSLPLPAAFLPRLPPCPCPPPPPPPCTSPLPTPSFPSLSPPAIPSCLPAAASAAAAASRACLAAFSAAARSLVAAAASSVAPTSPILRLPQPRSTRPQRPSSLGSGPCSRSAWQAEAPRHLGVFERGLLRQVGDLELHISHPTLFELGGASSPFSQSISTSQLLCGPDLSVSPFFSGFLGSFPSLSNPSTPPDHDFPAPRR